MGSKKDLFAKAVLQLIFQNTDILGIGDSGGLLGSITAGNLYIALFKNGLGPSDSAQGTECDYTGYARKAIPRNSTGWGWWVGLMRNSAVVTFDTCTAGTDSAGHFAVCKAGVAGVDDAIYWGDLTSDLPISAGVAPEFIIGALVITEN